MERQLKERLIGAAVLIAVAVIMVPEMFSGSGSNHASQDQTVSNAGSSESGQIKTYRIELQHRDAGTASSESTAQVLPVVPDTRLAASSVSTSMLPQAADSSSAASAMSGVSASSHSAEPVQAFASTSRSSASSTASSQGSVASGSINGWSVQVGSFETEATAKQIAVTAKSQGFPAYLASAKVGGKMWHRVRIGPFADRDAAAAAVAKLKHSYAQASLVAPNH